MPQRLLLVEDDPAVRRSLAETLEAEGVEVHLACTAEEALDRLVEDRRTREEGRRARASEAEAYHLDALVGRHPLTIEVYALPLGRRPISRTGGW